MKMTAVVDLSGKPTKAAASLFGEVREYFTSQPRSTESWGTDKFRVGGLEVRLVAGSLVEVTEQSTYREIDPTTWDIFHGFPTRHVALVDEGNDHFPKAGFYMGRGSGLPGIAKASATVRWKSEVNYSLDDSAVERLARIVVDRSSSRGPLHVEQPLLRTRSWLLALAASTINEARHAYALLRSDEWRPAQPFADVLPDDQKCRVITMTSVVGQEDD